MRAPAAHRVAWAALAVLATVLPTLPGEATDERPRLRLLRSSTDVHHSADGPLPVRVEVLFDYDRGVAIQRVRTLDGTLVESGPSGRIPAPSEAEIALAREIVMADSELQRTIVDLDIHLEGGFVLTEAPGHRCGPDTRCLQLFAFVRGDGRQPRFCAVVDLVDEEIAYRDYWGLRRGASP